MVGGVLRSAIRTGPSSAGGARPRRDRAYRAPSYAALDARVGRRRSRAQLAAGGGVVVTAAAAKPRTRTPLRRAIGARIPCAADEIQAADYAAIERARFVDLLIY